VALYGTRGSSSKGDGKELQRREGIVGTRRGVRLPSFLPFSFLPFPLHSMDSWMVEKVERWCCCWCWFFCSPGFPPSFLPTTKEREQGEGGLLVLNAVEWITEGYIRYIYTPVAPCQPDSSLMGGLYSFPA